MELSYPEGMRYDFIGTNFIFCALIDYVTGSEGLQVLFNIKREMMARIITF
jgi:hypothetical protein